MSTDNTYHDEAVAHTRAVFDDIHMSGTEGNKMGHYVADMADAAKGMAEALRLIADFSKRSYGRGSTDFRDSVEAALAAMPKVPQ